jgi:hypothetical protein
MRTAVSMGRSENIAVATIDRPQHRNAVDHAAGRQLTNAFRSSIVAARNTIDPLRKIRPMDMTAVRDALPCFASYSQFLDLASRQRPAELRRRHIRHIRTKPSTRFTTCSFVTTSPLFGQSQTKNSLPGKPYCSRSPRTLLHLNRLPLTCPRKVGYVPWSPGGFEVLERKCQVRSHSG